MVFRHGRDTVVLVGPYDLSPWLNSATAATAITPTDTSHFGTQAKTYIVGQDDGTFTFAGLFDGVRTALEDKITAIQAAGAIAGWPVTVAQDGGATIGRRVRYGIGRQTNWQITSPVGDVVAVSGNIQGDGGVDSGVLLNNLTAFSTTTLGAAVDNGAATTNGAAIGFHVVANANTAAATLKVQHSTDSTTWVDLATFVTTIATIGTSTANVTGTINRYLRFTATVSGTGAIQATATAARQ
jgi:hypothetical protein